MSTAFRAERDLASSIKVSPSKNNKSYVGMEIRAGGLQDSLALAYRRHVNAPLSLHLRRLVQASRPGYRLEPARESKRLAYRLR